MDLFDYDKPPVFIPDEEHLSIPEARRIITAIGLHYDIPEILEVVSKMQRRKPKYPVARAKRRSLTPELAERIRNYKRSHPNMSNREIGERFGVDGGRVSEAVHKALGF